jgi:hypothetical protein
MGDVGRLHRIYITCNATVAFFAALSSRRMEAHLAPGVQSNLERIRRYCYGGGGATLGNGSTALSAGKPLRAGGPAAARPAAPSVSTLPGRLRPPPLNADPASSYLPNPIEAAALDASEMIPKQPSTPLKSSLKQPKVPTRSPTSTAPPSGQATPSPPPQPSFDPKDQSRENFNLVVEFLRRRYDDPEPTSSLAALSAADIAGLAECLTGELRRIASRVSGGAAVTISVAPSPAVTSAPADLHPLPNTIKDGMILLRNGARVTKFSARKGEPALRHVRVQSRRSLVDGDMVAVPHFCWSAAASEEATGQLSLLDLKDLATGPSVHMKRNASGAVVGAFDEIIPDRNCLCLIFRARSLDIAFPTEAQCRAWEKALWFVIARNRRMDE